MITLRWIWITLLSMALFTVIMSNSNADSLKNDESPGGLLNDDDKAEEIPAQPLKNSLFQIKPNGMVIVTGLTFPFGDMVYWDGEQTKSTWSRRRKFVKETEKTWKDGGEIVTLTTVPVGDLKMTRTMTLKNNILNIKWKGKVPTLSPKLRIFYFEGHLYKTKMELPFVAVTTTGKTYRGDLTKGFEPIIGLKILTVKRSDDRELIIDFSQAAEVSMRARKDKKSPFVVDFGFLPIGYQARSPINPGQILRWEISMKLEDKKGKNNEKTE